MVDGKLGAVHDSAGKIRQRSFDEHRIRQVDGDDSPEIGVDGEHLRTFTAPFAIVGAEFAQNAIVDHFAGHFAGGEARKSDEFADIGSRHLRCGEKLLECGGDIADSNIGR